MKPLSSDTLFGNWATLLLCTDAERHVDYERLSDEIDVLISSAPNGIYSNSTSGKFYSQDREEFLKISGFLADKCEKAAINFQSGVSHPCPQESLWRLSAINSLRSSAVQVILPDWFPVDGMTAVSFMSVMADEAGETQIVLYNHPHAKGVLKPSKWQMIRQAVPSLIRVKVFDDDCSPQCYSQMKDNSNGIAVSIPGHHLATEWKNGARGAYSNIACLNPFAAQKWFEMMTQDLEAALELESRIRTFVKDCIDPFISEMHHPNPACDRFMALVGNWADVESKMRWSYSSIPVDYVPEVKEKARKINLK